MRPFVKGGKNGRMIPVCELGLADAIGLSSSQKVVTVITAFAVY
jgi:hypothetical protein